MRRLSSHLSPELTLSEGMSELRIPPHSILPQLSLYPLWSPPSFPQTQSGSAWHRGEAEARDREGYRGPGPRNLREGSALRLSQVWENPSPIHPLSKQLCPQSPSPSPH